MRAHKYQPNYTLADYEMWEGDWELIDGYPYSMSPSPSSNHQRLASKLHVQLVLNLGKLPHCNQNCEVLYELDWRINHNTVVRPDIVLVCNLTDKFITKPPVLIIELLSASNALRDLGIKYDLYQEQGVPYYITIEPDTRKFSINALINGFYEKRNDLTSFSISTDCDVAFDIAQILAETKNRI